MANDTVKTIRERIKFLNSEKKLREGISDEERKQLKGLRAQLKEVRNLEGHQKDILKGALDRQRLEKLHHKNLQDETTFGKELSAISSTQLEITLKAVKGKLTEADITAQLIELEEVELEIARNRAIGHDSIADKLEAQVDYIKEGLDIAKDAQKTEEARTVVESKLKDLSNSMMEDMDKLVPGLGGAVKKGKEFIGVLKKHPMKAMQMAALAVVALMVKMVLVMRELKKEFGTTDQQTARLQGNLVEAGFALKFMGISGAEVKATATAIMEEFGNINNVSTETLKSMGKLHATLGIAGADAAKLLSWMEGISGSTREQLLNQIKFQGELAQAKGVAPAAVMKDVASQTELFADFAKDGGANIFEAATQARALGLNLGTVAKIADSLLDFESSVNAQMEASMMIGRNINSDRARQLALQGDLAGMQKEVLKQLGSEAEFNNMNRLQRQAMAKAFGLSTEELSKMVREQEKLNQRFSMVTWFLEKLAAVTGLFTKLRPILEAVGVIFAVVLLPSMIKWTVKGIIGIARLVTGLVLANAVLLGQAAMWVINTIAANLFWAAATLGISLLIAGIVAMIMNWDKVKAWFSDNAGKIASYLKLAFFPIFMIIEGIKLVMSGAKKLASFFGGGGGEVATEGTVGAQHGGIFTTPTNVNVAEAGTAEAVIPLDPAGIKVNNEDLLEKLDILIATMGGVKTEVREMGVK